LSVFSRRDNLGDNPGGELVPFFFFFFVGVIWFVHDCAVVTEGEDDTDRNDEAGNDKGEKDSDDDDNCRIDSDNASTPGCFFAAILNSPFLIFFGGVTIEEDTLRPLEGLPSDGNRFLIVFAMVQILCGVVFF
jgi:hypothetical protein